MNSDIITHVLKNLRNGKAVGKSNIKPELYKYGASSSLIRLLQVLFSTMISRAVIPHNFNLGIIKPLVKDPSKPTNEINNLRPVTVSDVSATIY